MHTYIHTHTYIYSRSRSDPTSADRQRPTTRSQRSTEAPRPRGRPNPPPPPLFPSPPRSTNLRVCAAAWVPALPAPVRIYVLHPSPRLSVCVCRRLGAHSPRAYPPHPSPFVCACVAGDAEWVPILPRAAAARLPRFMPIAFIGAIARVASERLQEGDSVPPVSGARSFSSLRHHLARWLAIRLAIVSSLCASAAQVALEHSRKALPPSGATSLSR